MSLRIQDIIGGHNSPVHLTTPCEKIKLLYNKGKETLYIVYTNTGNNNIENHTTSQLKIPSLWLQKNLISKIVITTDKSYYDGTITLSVDNIVKLLDDISMSDMSILIQSFRNIHTRVALETVIKKIMIPNKYELTHEKIHGIHKELYSYQIKNIKWMKLVEDKAIEPIKIRSSNIIKLYSKDSDEILYFDTLCKTFKTCLGDGDFKYLYLNGGCIIDEMGYGKTLCAVVHSAFNNQYIPKDKDKEAFENFYNMTPDETNKKGYRSLKYRLIKCNTTLIFTKNGLCDQWRTEIYGIFGKTQKKVIIISTKLEYEKVSYQDIINADFVIVSYTFCFSNKAFAAKHNISSDQITDYYINRDDFAQNMNYYEIFTSNGGDKITVDALDKYINNLPIEDYKTFLQKKEILFTLFLWNRIYYDEIHELVCVANLGVNKRNSNGYRSVSLQSIIKYMIQGRFKWFLTGTPFTRDVNYIDYIKLLSQYNYDAVFSGNDNMVVSAWKDIIPRVLRRNDNVSTQKEVILAPPLRYVTYIEMTKPSKQVYDIMRNTGQHTDGWSRELMNFCTCPQAADTFNDCQTLDEVKTNLVEKNKALIEECSWHLQQRKSKIDFYKSSLVIPFSLNNDLEKIKECIMTINKEFVEEIMIEVKAYKKYEDAMRELNRKKEYMDGVLRTIDKLHNASKDTGVVADDDLQCKICMEDLKDISMSITECGHIYCSQCIDIILGDKKKDGLDMTCPHCRQVISPKNILRLSKKEDKELYSDIVLRYGSKMATIILFIQDKLAKTEDKIIIFSRYTTLLKIVHNILKENNIGSMVFEGNVMVKNSILKKFKNNDDCRVIMLSSQKSASGTNLTVANIIIFIEPYYDSDNINDRIHYEAQAIGRVLRIGQTKPVEVHYFITKDTIEHEIFKGLNYKTLKIIEDNGGEGSSASADTGGVVIDINEKKKPLKLNSLTGTYEICEFTEKDIAKAMTEPVEKSIEYIDTSTLVDIRDDEDSEPEDVIDNEEEQEIVIVKKPEVATIANIGVRNVIMHGTTEKGKGKENAVPKKGK